MFATAIYFHPSLIFAGKASSLPLEWSPARAPLFWQTRKIKRLAVRQVDDSCRMEPLLHDFPASDEDVSTAFVGESRVDVLSEVQNVDGVVAAESRSL